MRPAKSRLEAAVRAQKEMLEKSRHLAAQQAVTRSINDVDEVIEGGDPAEIGGLHKQLQKQRETLTATAVQLGDEQLNVITELLIIVDKSLRRLNKKRRELIRVTNAGSLFSPSPSEGGDNGGGENVQLPRVVLPPAEEQDATTPEAGLSSNQLCQLLTMLVSGNHSKLPPLSWPKFNNSYRSYFAFKDELEAFIRDYGQGTSARTLAQQIKSNCLSKNSAAYMEWTLSPAVILETLGGLLGCLSILVESLLEPVRKQKRIQMDDIPALLAYLTVVRNILQEIKRLGQMQLFSTVANIDLIVEKMPTIEIEKWMEETEGLRDNQLVSALEKFVLDCWRHCGAILAHTTTAEQALKAIVGGSGQQHQQSGGKPASPNSRQKNKPPFKKSGGGPPKPSACRSGRPRHPDCAAWRRSAGSSGGSRRSSWQAAAGGCQQQFQELEVAACASGPCRRCWAPGCEEYYIQVQGA
jgi:hypothetical protein